MRHLTLLTLVCCLLTACAAGPQPTPGQPVQVPPQANLTAPPQPLPPPASGQMSDLEANHRQVAKQYHQLAAQVCGLLKFLQIPHRSSRLCSQWERGTEPAENPF